MSELKLIDDRMSLVIKPTRAPLSPKLRFQVLRRDGFTCQYCGRTGQERELEIDHIIPVSLGGTNDIGNLQTSCVECNKGKRAEDIISRQPEIRYIEKVVIKEVPVEKIVYKDASIPITNHAEDLSPDLSKEELKTNYNLLQVLRLLTPKTQEIELLIKRAENTTNRDEAVKILTEIQSKSERTNTERITNLLNSGAQENKTIKMKCKRQDCNTEWDYKGTKRYPMQVCCPCCGNKVRVPKEETK